MALSGSLEDIAIVDVLQILGMSGKSGILHVGRDGKKVEVGFAKGRIIAAIDHPFSSYLSEWLLASGIVSPEEKEALPPPENVNLPFWVALCDSGELSGSQLEKGVVQAIQAHVAEIARWTTGEFSFDMGEPRDKPGWDALPAPAFHVSGFAPQEILLDAARINDETEAGIDNTPPRGPSAEISEESEDRAFAESLPGPPRPADPGAGDEFRLEEDSLDDKQLEVTLPIILLCADPRTQARLTEGLQPHPVVLNLAPTYEDARMLLAQLVGRRPILVIDTDMLTSDHGFDSRSFQSVLQQRRESGRVPIITFGTGRNARLMAGVLAVGVVSHIPRPADESASPEAQQQFESSLIAAVVREATQPPAEEQFDSETLQGTGYVESLYRAMLELRQSVHSVTISLDLLRFVADHLERAILFLIKNDCLIGLGGFGVQVNTVEEPAKGVPQIRLPVHPDSSIARMLVVKTVLKIDQTDTDPLLRSLYEMIGLPYRPEAMLIPIVVTDKVSSMIYADNGRQRAMLCSPEPLGILVEHAGLLLENLYLRKQLAQQLAPVLLLP